MQLTNRDKVVILIVPAILIVGSYAWWINSSSGRQTELARLRKNVEDAERIAPSQEAINQQKALTLKLNADLNRLQSELSKEKGEWDRFAGQVFNPATRHERVQKLNGLLLKSGLTLLGDEPAEAGGTDAGHASPTLEAFAKAVSDRSPTLKPKTWRIRLYGRYANLLRALQLLSDSETLCVPVGLTMAEWNINTPAQEWTLLVWI